MSPTWDPPWWLWVTRSAIPLWGNGIALKAAFVHFFVQSEPEEGHGAPPNVPWVEKGGRPEPMFAPLLSQRPLRLGKTKRSAVCPKGADNELEWKVPYKERE